MIQIRVNDQPKQVGDGAVLAEQLTLWGFDCRKVAVAINEDFVPRSAYDTTQLQDNDRVDVVAPVQGG